MFLKMNIFLNAVKGLFYNFCVFIIVCKIPHVFENEHHTKIQ